LNSISPNAKVSHLPTFTLTAIGSNFNPGSIIVFNGIQKQTSYTSSTELTCQVETDEITLSALTVFPGNNVSRTSRQEIFMLFLKSTWEIWTAYLCNRPAQQITG
jgi:hypothetical protein